MPLKRVEPHHVPNLDDILRKNPEDVDEDTKGLCYCTEERYWAEEGLYLKALLADELPYQGQDPLKYKGVFEGVWILVTQGSVNDGWGILVSIPVSVKSADQGYLVRYEAVSPLCKPVIRYAFAPWETWEDKKEEEAEG